jgi:putative membrane protein
MYYGHWGWGFMWFGWIFWLAVVIIVVWLIFRVRGDARYYHGHGPFETPLDILKKRYAKGEISKEDYDRMRKDLES